MTNYLNLKLALFLSIAAVSGQQSTPLKEVDQYLQKYLDKSPVSGFSIVIVEGEKVKFIKGYGKDYQSSTRPFTPNSTIAINSIGRGFTAVAILQLVERGLLDLDKPVTDYLPWFKTANKEFSDQVTLRMCLSNSSGIPPQYESFSDLDSESAVESFVRSFESYVIKRKPGKSHEFCDEGYSIAGLIISQVSGMSYYEYIHKNIFAPLQMNRSAASRNQATNLRINYGHEIGLAKCIPAIEEAADVNYLAAGSEFYSCATDLGNYMIALLNGGKYNSQQIISKSSLEQLFKPNISFQGLGTMVGGNGIDIGYALGWMDMSIEERNILIHTGNDGNVASIIGINKEKDQAFAMLFNTDVNIIDRSEYPGMEHTVNNVIHLINAEDTTDFGIVRNNGLFDDDYELPEDKWEKYIGKYESFGRPNPFFKNMNIEVLIGKGDTLELIARKEKIFKGHYGLDFTNESRAILRNPSFPRQVQFALYPDGSIGGLFMNGTEFKKRNPANEKRFNTVNPKDNSFSILLPKSAHSQWQENVLSAKLFEDSPTSLTASTIPLKEQVFDEYLEQQLQGKPIKSKGAKNKSTVKNGLWTEQTLVVEDAGAIMQYIMIYYQDPLSQKQLQITIKSPWGGFTSELQEVIMMIRKSVELR